MTINIDTWLECKQDLQKLAKEAELRPDWHNADCDGMDAKMVYGPLDNAHCDEDEAHVILTHDTGDCCDTEPHHYGINLANLLAWASE